MHGKDMHGRGAYMAGVCGEGMQGMGCAWQDTCIAGEHVWWRGGYEWQGVMLGSRNAWQGSVWK